MGVAGVEETEKAEVLFGAVDVVEAARARGVGQAIQVGDTVEDGDIARAGKVVRGGVPGARKLNIVKASAAAILAVIQPLSLPFSNVHGSGGFRPSCAFPCLQSLLGSARRNICVISYSTILPGSVPTPLIESYVRRKDFRVSVSSRPLNWAQGCST